MFSKHKSWKYLCVCCKWHRTTKFEKCGNKFCWTYYESKVLSLSDIRLTNNGRKPKNDSNVWCEHIKHWEWKCVTLTNSVCANSPVDSSQFFPPHRIGYRWYEIHECNHMHAIWNMKIRSGLVLWFSLRFLKMISISSAHLNFRFKDEGEERSELCFHWIPHFRFWYIFETSTNHFNNKFSNKN